MRGAVGTDSTAVAVPLVSEVYGNAVGLPRFDKKILKDVSNVFLLV